MAKDILFGNDRIIGSGSPAFIIAEIGQNHQGDINIAKRLIKAAKDAGADCVKFQKTCLTEKFNKGALERPYLSENSWGPTYGDHKRHLEFGEEDFQGLQEYAGRVGVPFTASAMDLVSLEFLVRLGVPFVKIGSGDSNNLTLIEEAARKRVPLVISTGMVDMKGVEEIYSTVSKHHKDFVLMHCVSAYPTPLEDVNLRVIETYRKRFPDVHIGYSGHEMGIDVTTASIALGAKVIERHITLDRNQKGSDHKCSLEPRDFAEMVRKIRDLETALGSSVKRVQESEGACRTKLGKTLVAAQDLPKGHRLDASDLKVKVAEPRGVDALCASNVIGKRLNRNVGCDESVMVKDFQ